MARVAVVKVLNLARSVAVGEESSPASGDSGFWQKLSDNSPLYVWIGGEDPPQTTGGSGGSWRDSVPAHSFFYFLMNFILFICQKSWRFFTKYGSRGQFIVTPWSKVKYLTLHLVVHFVLDTDFSNQTNLVSIYNRFMVLRYNKVKLDLLL